ncbi:hypothetical protein BJY01DRAFT_251651 [Aspergillus pseudoustus]|uniref:Uncharacterized protein n=1 Tax=Aspergillus pseudoustus TaxID=1810923 RepID=A0ABR4JDJ5_9EURO
MDSELMDTPGSTRNTPSQWGHPQDISISIPTMKLHTYLLPLLGVYATAELVRSPNAGPNAEAECGSLGVMYYDPAELPEGVFPEDVRKCRDHPLGRQAWPGADEGIWAWIPNWVF